MFHLPPAFRQFEEVSSWKGIKYQGPENPRPENVDIDAAGPMLHVTRKDQTSFLIFSQNYSPMQGNFQNRETIVLQFTGDPMMTHTFVFPTVDAMQSFMIFYLESMKTVCDLVNDASIPTIQLNDSLMGLMPGESSLSQLDVCLTSESFTAVLLKKEHSKSKKIWHKSKHQDKTTLTFTLGTNIIASPVFSWSKKLGRYSLMERTFRIFDVKGKTELQVIAQTPEAAMNWVLRIHIAIARRSRPLPRANTVTQPVKKTQSVPEVQPKTTQMMDTASLPPQTRMLSPHEENVAEPVVEEEQKEIEVEVVEIESENVAIPSEDVEIPKETPKDDEKEHPQARTGRLRSIKAGNKKTPDEEKDDKPRKSFLPNGPTTGILLKEYEEFLKSHEPVHPEAVVMPDLRTILVDTARDSVKLDTFSIDEQIQHAIDCLSVMDEEKIDTNTFEQIETNELIESVLSQYEFDEKLDFESVVDFSGFPSYDKSLLINPPGPQIPFVSEITTVVESINLMETKVIYYDSTPSRKLVFLVASLFLNGLKGLKELTNRKLLMRAMRELLEFCPSFAYIVDRASKEPDVASQASVMACMLLNSDDLVPFLKQVIKHDAWISKYYRVSAQIASETVIDMIVALLTPVMSSIDFILGERTTVIAEAHPDDVYKFITGPAFGYLEMSEVNTEEELITALSKQMLYGVKQTKLKGYGLPVQFQFVVAVAKQNRNTSDPNWMKFVEETLAISDQAARFASRQDLHEDWLRSSFNHGNLLTRFLYLILSQEVVADFYNEYSSMRDPYRANYVLHGIARVLNRTRPAE